MERFLIFAALLLLPGLDGSWQNVGDSNDIQNRKIFSPNLRTNQIPANPRDQYDSSGRSFVGPMFDSSTPNNITALKDSNAYLYCNVLNASNKTIVWIREHDLHILTVGLFTYTADERFEVIHKANSTSWILKIHSVQMRDAGRYECQVNTQNQIEGPKSFHVLLKVYVPSAKIIGTSERFVNRGSTINLTCLIEHHHHDDTSATSFWLQNNKKINYENRDNLVSVITDRGPVIKTTLLIHGVNDAASGIYSCSPSPSTSVTVKIHILNGQPPAAMQTNTGVGGSIINLYFIIIATMIQSFSFYICDITS